MNETSVSGNNEHKPRIGVLGRIARGWQWLFTTFLALIVIAQLSYVHRLSAPDAPVVLFWIMVGVGAIIVLAHATPIFTRLPGKAKVAAYIALPLYVLLMGRTGIVMDEAWQKTPQGAAEAKQQAKADRKYEIEHQAERKAESDRLETERQLAEANALQQEIADRAEKLQGCFSSWSGKIPRLEDSVRESLHNPHAFEHVETFAIAPDAEGHNVAMRFRAENGMGALRTWVVKAEINPDSCEVTSTGDPEQA